MSELPPLPSDITALLEVERSATVIRAEQAARLDARLAKSLGIPLGGAVASASHAADGGLDPSSAGDVATGLDAAAVQTATLGIRAIVLIGTFVAGAAVGAGVVLATRPNAPPPLESVQVPEADQPDTPLPLPHEEAETSDTPAESTIPSPAERPPAESSPTPRNEIARSETSRSATPRSSDSRRDLVLLERARVALARGHHRQALAALLEHEQRFPSQGREGRDALRVQATAASGRTEHARALARQFVERYPRSLYRHAVQATLDSTPAPEREAPDNSPDENTSEE